MARTYIGIRIFKETADKLKKRAQKEQKTYDALINNLLKIKK